MSTSPCVLESLSPILLAYLETPYANGEAPPIPYELFRTTYSRRLAFHGLSEKAVRADAETSYFQWFRDADRQTWRQHAANAMLRTMPYYAKQLAEEQYHKNLPLGDFIADEFCRVNFQILTWDVAEAQRLIAVLRAMTSKLLPKSLDKIAVLDGTPAIKILYTKPMTLDLAKRIQAAIPSGVKFQYSNHQKEYFRAHLRSVTSSDLITSDTHRADLEAILDSSHQTKLHKFSKEERSKFVYESTDLYTNLSGEEPSQEPAQESTSVKKRGKPIPKNPATGKPAIWASKIVSENVKASDIPEHEWMLLSSD